MAQLWGGRFTKQTDQMVYDFNASIRFDKRLLQQDIEGSIAHVVMLEKQGILTCEAGSRISDHLWNSGISAEYGHHFYPDPLCHCHGTVSVHSVSGASL